MDFVLPISDSEIHNYDVEKLKAMLPNLDMHKESNQLEIILQAIKYIRELQNNLEANKQGVRC
jgi:hypothetical protein